ncbi:MAG: hypothetical protein J6L98_04175 [Bacteroidales bacterium]|nr:hypothetical protein [Bacteroidales bacterium]MBP3269858.1 hypothetical protein [Bacteroidales bacterium]
MYIPNDCKGPVPAFLADVSNEIINKVKGKAINSLMAAYELDRLISGSGQRN